MLSNHEYFVVVPDLPACGQSSPLAKPSVAEYCQTLASFWHKLKSPIVIGQSFGGQLAVVLTTHCKISRLILVAPAIVRTHTGGSSRLLALLKLFAPMRHILPAAWRYHLSSGTDYAESTEAQKQVIRQVLEDTTAERRLSEINIPTCIIWGEYDHELIGTGKQLQSRILGSKLKCIYDAGHNLHLEKPAELLQHVRLFLETMP